MRVSALQRPARSTYGIKFIQWVIKSSKTRVGVLLFLSFVLGFWVHRHKMHWPVVRWIETHINTHSVSLYLNSLTGTTQLPTLTIDVKFKHLKKIERKRQEALSRGVLLASNDDFVPAKLHFEDQTVSAKLRLKGDLQDHWAGDKWSFRIRIKDDNHLFGMRRFSIQHPGTRDYLYEWAFLECLRREDIMAPRYQFIQVIFNGTNKGIYALEEHFADELLASAERREGVIVKTAERDMWADSVDLLHLGPFQPLRKWGFANSHFETFQSSHIDSLPLLARQRDEALALLRAFQEGRRKPSEVFDVEIMARYMALTELWYAWHTTLPSNTRYYYNPITARLEPIGFDGLAFSQRHRDLKLFWVEWWRDQFLQDPVMARAYVRELRRLSQPSFIDELEDQIGEEMQSLLGTLAREFAMAERLTLPWGELRRRQEFIRKVLAAPSRMVLAYSVERRIASAGEPARDLIEVRNVLDLPVEILGFQAGEEAIVPAAAVWGARPQDPALAVSDQIVCLPGAKKEAMPAYSYFVFPISDRNSGNNDAQNPPVYVHTRLIGHERVIRTPVLYQPQVITTANYDENITIEQVLAKHEFLAQREKPGELWIKSGTWEVLEDLVVPKRVRLRAGPNTVLKFSENAVLVAQGPLDLKGTAQQPVVLQPLHATWPGMVVMKADHASTLAHVTIKGTRGIARRGWILTGGVTFYKSPVLIQSCHFENSLAEDGLNIIRTEFNLRGSRFSNCASDAFDGDFVTGTVQGCEFTGIHADGVDLSGSEVSIVNAVFDHIGDKAVSAGERSTVQVRSISVSQSRFGVVSKDCSKVSVDRSTFRQVQYGLAAFVKKSEFGPAHLEAREIRMTQVAKPALVQTGSTLTIDGQDQAAEELDVQSLYRTSAIDDRKSGKL